MRISAGILPIREAPARNQPSGVRSGICVSSVGIPESAMPQALNASFVVGKKKATRRWPFYYFLRGTLGTEALGVAAVGRSSLMTSAEAFSSTGFFGAGFFRANGFL